MKIGRPGGSLAKSNKRLIFVRWIRHAKTGKIIYPKNGKVFAIWVDDDKKQE